MSPRTEDNVATWRMTWLGLACLLFVGCAAGSPQFTSEAPAGFWLGIWHGLISFVTLVIGIFNDHVRVYEVDNTGGWYDFGFLIGVTMLWGHRTITHRRKALARLVPNLSSDKPISHDDSMLRLAEIAEPMGIMTNEKIDQLVYGG